MQISKTILVLFTLGTFASCTKVVTKEAEKSQDNGLTNKSEIAVKEVVDENVRMRFMTQGALTQMIQEGSIKSMQNKMVPLELSGLQTAPKAEVAAEDDADETDENNLFIGFPTDLLGQQNVFGGVITKISDTKNEEIGSLKLTDLTPIHVTTAVSSDESGSYLTLRGCVQACDEMSAQPSLLSFPLIGMDMEKKELIVDMSQIGESLNLLQMLDPTGEGTKLKAISSETSALDYSLTTLVFDVKSKFIPVGREETDPTVPVTEVTVRWYLKLNSGFNPAFTVRTPVSEVGFFKTERSKEPKIMRHSVTFTGNKKIHYYIKNVPEEFKNFFKLALDQWNTEFRSTIGRDVITYEFIPAGDPKNEQIIAGDIRFNVIEWDLVNLASYGGLGPSIANQHTGEMMSSNTLVQGPKIVELYTKWFKVSAEARTLLAQGREEEAEEMMKKFASKVMSDEAKAKAITYEVKLGNIPMIVHSQRPELHDPIIKGLFEIVPEGMTFETYMPGYFQEIIAHEIGHNLGLRHNFRGSLGSNDSKTRGSVSRSVMEYLGRSYRHLNAIGLYDRMAIAYGYKGTKPTHADWFCTDEDQGLDAKSILERSPECSKSDATSDPFSYWESRLMRAIDIMIQPKTNRAPVLTIAHIKSEVEDMSTGFAAYALSAEKTAEKWTNFFGIADRPEDKKDVKAYVMNSLTSRICNPAIATIIASKETPEASKATQASYEVLVKTMTDQMVKVGLLKEKEVICK